MKGDFSHWKFHPEKHYRSVLMQQGRVLLDADWNENATIEQYLQKTKSQDVIGSCGTPKHDPGFGITTKGSALIIGPGRYYVDGILCENEMPVAYGSQPYLTNPREPKAFFTPGVKAGRLYLDVWFRHVTVVEDPSLREVALGGPDTTTRVQAVWQVKLLAGADSKAVERKYRELINKSTQGKMKARTRSTTGPADDDVCRVPPQAGYFGLENQLYRVEIHKGGPGEDATFKWSRDNGSVVTPIEKISGKSITVAEIGRDPVLEFAVGQWIEVVSDQQELGEIYPPSSLVKISAVDKASRVVTVETGVGAVNEVNCKRLHYKLRRWDQIGNQATPSGVEMKTGWLPLEKGIEVQFSGQDYKTGDYWLIPARSLSGSIEWPLSDDANSVSLEQLPLGVEHHYCPLADIQLKAGDVLELKDRRSFFPPLTYLQAQDVTFNNRVCKLSDVETVQDALEELCRAKSGCGCVVPVGKGMEFEHLDEALAGLLQKKQRDICICLLPGDHVIEKDLRIGEMVNLKISGCGPGTRLKIAQSTLHFRRLQSIQLRHLTFIAEGERDLLQCVDCAEVIIDSCSIIGTAHGSVLATIGGSKHIHLSNNSLEAISRTGRKGLPTVLNAAHDKLPDLFKEYHPTEYHRKISEVADELDALSRNKREEISKKIEYALRNEPKVSKRSRKGFDNLRSIISKAKIDKDALFDAVGGLRRESFEQSPGTALLILDGGADTIIENNRITGAVSLYGRGGTNDLNHPLLRKNRKVFITRTEFSDDGHLLHVRNNTFTRWMVADSLVVSMEKILTVVGSVKMDGVYRKAFFTDNVFNGGPNLFLAMDLFLTSNTFLQTNKPAGGSVADTAIYTGNHSRAEILLYDFTTRSADAANLGIEVLKD